MRLLFALLFSLNTIDWICTHLQKNKLRLRGLLLTNSGDVYSRTPKKDHIKSFEGEYYRNYLKTINNEIGHSKNNIEDEN